MLTVVCELALTKCEGLVLISLSFISSNVTCSRHVIAKILSFGIQHQSLTHLFSVTSHYIIDQSIISMFVIYDPWDSI
jgi:hypothetical protein